MSSPTGCASAVPPPIDREYIITDAAVKIGAILLTRSGIGWMRVFGGNAVTEAQRLEIIRVVGFAWFLGIIKSQQEQILRGDNFVEWLP